MQQRVADPNSVVPETCAVPCTLPDSLAAEPSLLAAAAAAPAAPHSPSLQNADWPEAATSAEPGDAGQHVRLVGQVALQAEVCASPPLWPQGSQGEQQIPETPDELQPLQDMHENVAEAAALQPTSCAAWPAPCAPVSSGATDQGSDGDGKPAARLSTLAGKCSDADARVAGPSNSAKQLQSGGVGVDKGAAAIEHGARHLADHQQAARRKHSASSR